MPTPVLHRWFPFLAWPRPSGELLQGEFWAGMTVGLMLVPQGVAYAALARSEEHTSELQSQR